MRISKDADRAKESILDCCNFILIQDIPSQNNGYSLVKKNNIT